MFEQQSLLDQLGSNSTNHVVARFNRFAFMHNDRLANLAADCLTENWGNNHFALRFYLSVMIPWSIEQGNFTHSENQIYLTAGHLQTRYGTPLYLVFEQNERDDPPWFLVTHGSHIAAGDLPIPPQIPEAPEIPVGAEIVMMHDHILADHPERIPFLQDTPRVAQMCAIAGAVQWSLNRNLEFCYWYYGKMHYLVPLYLETREDITRAPDAIAPVQINRDNLLVRTVLEPHMPYAKARVGTHRHDQLPTWLLAAWAEHAATITEDAIENPDGDAGG
jgi:hypothetical protein